MKQIILGLGSNIGDRLSYLRQAIHGIRQMPDCVIEQISPLYLSDALTPEDAPENWNLPFLNVALQCKTHLSAEAFLIQTQKIEAHIGRIPGEKWSPRIIDIDLLAYENQIIQTEQLKIPHPDLLDRPFALWPLSDLTPHWIHPIALKNAGNLAEKWGSRFSGETLFHTRQIAQRIKGPQLMGIINLTPDSFSDGGKFQTTDDVLNHVKHLINAGAEIIDLGAEATNPTVKSISAQIEWSRLEPVLTELIQQKKTFTIPPIISIDTRHPLVAKKALALGADWINDVSGLDDPDMRKIIAKHPCRVIMMHHLGIPVDPKICLPDDRDPIEVILQWAEKRMDELTKQNIQRKNIIFDPGVGFGKNPRQSLHIIKHIEQFKQLNVPILVGHSRKRFLELFTDQPFDQRDEVTTRISTQFLKNVDYLRVHNVEMHAQGFKMFNA